MVNPRGKVVRTGATPGMRNAVQISELGIHAWCPDEKAQAKAEQVHVSITIQGVEDLPLVFRFKSPDTLGFFIEELERYRRYVWPEAEPLNLEGGQSGEGES